jgi:small subunit ribosomal protein S4
MKLYLKGERCETQKCAIVRKNYAPGMNGPKGSFSKKSEYARQLREKQKGKRIFNIGEKQFEAYYAKALKSEDITSDALLKLLETRLDNVVYRAGFASSRNQARQYVSHGLITLNGKPVTIPSIQTKTGDKFQVHESNRDSKTFGEIDKRKSTSPAWIKSDLKSLSGEVLRQPEKAELESSVAGHLIVEYYSK